MEYRRLGNSGLLVSELCQLLQPAGRLRNTLAARAGGKHLRHVFAGS